jgi:uncharacterized protein YbjQ (UPF0145 family)
VNRSIVVLVVAVTVGLVGCTPYQTQLTNAERSYPPTTADKVQLFLQGETVPKATEIGEIIVLEDSEESGIAYLQKKAAEMGADGVVGVEVKIQTRILFVLIPIPIHSYFVSGTAVKYATISMGASQ